MPTVNDTGGQLFERANPFAGTAELHWAPLPDLMAVGRAQLQGLRVDIGFFRLLSLKALVWDQSLKPPFSWLVIAQPSPEPVAPDLGTLWGIGEYIYKQAKTAAGYPTPVTLNIPTTIIVFVAPHVEVVEHPLQLPENLVAPLVRIVRLGSAEAVPEPQTEMRLEDYLGPFDLQDVADLEHEVSELQDFGIAAVREDTALTLRHSSGGYSLRIALDRAKPCAFDLAYRQGLDARRRPQDQYFVGRTDGVSILAQRHEEIGVAAFRNLAVYEYGIARQVMEASVCTGTMFGVADAWSEEAPPFARAIIRDNLAGREPTGYVEAVRSAVSEVEQQVVHSIPGTNNPLLRAVIEMSIGMVPVVGQLYDVAQITSVVCTGRDLWGSEVDDGQLSLMAGFAALGAFGDAGKIAEVGAEVLGPLRRVGATLFPNVRVVSANAGLSRLFLGAVFECTDPAFAAAVERALAGDETLEFAKKLEAAARELVESGATIKAVDLGKELVEAVFRNMDEVARLVPIERQPAFLALARKLNIEGLPARELLDPERYKAIKTLVDDAAASGMSDDLLARIKEIDADFADAWLEALRADMKARLTSNPRVVEAFKRYAARRGEDLDVDMLTYALKRARGSLREMIRLCYGQAGIDFMLGVSPGRDSRSIEEVLDSPGMLDAVKALLNRMDTYERLREAVQSGPPGLGRLLEADHLIERRIRILSEVQMADPHYYLSMLVPASDEVADLLRSRGIGTMAYVHKAKTARMAQLIPQGKEMGFAIQDIADIYQLFWVHEMGMTYGQFRRLFAADFAQLAHDAAQGNVKLAQKTKDELLRAVSRRRIDLGSQRVFLTKISERATTAPIR